MSRVVQEMDLHPVQLVLWPKQVHKLLNGGRVIVRGDPTRLLPDTVFLTPAQATRHAKAITEGRGFALEFAPEQRRFHLEHGTGIFDVIKRVWSGQRNHASPELRKQLEREGSQRIVRLAIARSPVERIVQYVLDYVSSGQWSAAKHAIRADDAFHVYFVATLEDGQLLRVEKNAVVSISTFRGSTDEMMSIPLYATKANPLTLDSMLAGAEKFAGSALWTYHPTHSNCQDFAMAVIHGNSSAIVNSKALESFVKQDAETLSRVMGLAARLLAEGTTDFAGRLHHAVYGSGIRVPRRLTRK